MSSTCPLSFNCRYVVETGIKAVRHTAATSPWTWKNSESSSSAGPYTKPEWKGRILQFARLTGQDLQIYYVVEGAQSINTRHAGECPGFVIAQ